MPDPLLNPTQRQQIERLVATDTTDNVRRRARLLLLLDDGQPTRQAAEAVGITPGRARHWRGLFRSKGMLIFPDATHPDAPAYPTKEPSIVTTEISPGAVSPLTIFLAEAANLKFPGVQPDDLLSEAGRKVLRYHFGQMLLHEDGTRLGEDIEELHDMRVATRRMRAAFEVFADAYTPKSLKKLLNDLRTTGRTLGKVRDLDVFIEKARHYEAALPPDRQADLEPLLASWGQEREQARAKMVDYLDSNKYADFKLEYYEFLSTPFAGARQQPEEPLTPRRVREIAPVLIYTRLASVRAFDAILENATLEQFHALRIEFKKLRYTVEFFREVLGDEERGVINDLKTIQDHLGDLNDAQVATQILRDFLTQWDNQQSALPVSQRTGPEAVLAYLLYRYAEREQLMQSFQEKWQLFNQSDFQHRLALAVSTL